MRGGGDTEIGTWRPEGAAATAPANHSGDGAADRKASSHTIETILNGRKVNFIAFRFGA
jgi:hypothetical protein